MIEKLTYINEKGGRAEFSLRSQYRTDIKYGVTGLSTIRNALFSFTAIGQDGATLLGNQVESRDLEIVGKIRTRANAMPPGNERNFVKEMERQVKHNLIRTLNPHFQGMLVYECGSFKRIIPCKVDSAIDFRGGVGFETFIIQVCCLSPYWREEHMARNEIALWIGVFEFPDDDGGLELRDEEGWEIEYRSPSLIVNVENKGDVETGMRVDFSALGIVETPTLLNINTRQFIKINMTLAAGDVLSVSTGYNEKAVTLHRGGEEINAFWHLDFKSSYMQLAPGDNLFRYDAAVNLENLEVTIFHNNLYFGV